MHIVRLGNLRLPEAHCNNIEKSYHSSYSACNSQVSIVISTSLVIHRKSSTDAVCKQQLIFCRGHTASKAVLEYLQQAVLCSTIWEMQQLSDNQEWKERGRGIPGIWAASDPDLRR